jgi:hypothetical protein
MLYREIIAVCSQIHTKHINTLCGPNVELLSINLVVHIGFRGLVRLLYVKYVSIPALSISVRKLIYLPFQSHHTPIRTSIHVSESNHHQKEAMKGLSKISIRKTLRDFEG